MAIPTKIGRYDIIELVGRGGMGVLYRARDATLERDVALKMMLVDFSVDPSARERFEREAKAVARLQHRNIVTIHELGNADGAPYIVMEFLSGQDLDTLLKAEPSLTLAQKLDVTIQLCEGLGYAHEQGIVHRDIKPGNVRVLEDGTVKILDFGIAKFAVSSVTQSGSILGTPSYMSPEQVMGQPVDGRADLFSAGVLLYELLGGKKPFAGDAPTAVVYQIMHVEPPPLGDLVADLPEALHEVVGRALQKNPNERYGRATEMASDLQMVKMMLDLPLNPAGVSSSDNAANTTGKLFATMIRERTATGTTSPMLHARMRTSAVAATADAAPRKRWVEGGPKGLVWIIAAVVVIGIGLAAFLLQDGTSTTAGPPAATPAAAPGAPAAAAATPPAAAGLLAVSSTPAGARISLNGVDTGKVTPAAVSAKAADVLQLSVAGYQPNSSKVTSDDLRNGNINFSFTRPEGPVRLIMTGTYPFELAQGSRVLSAAATRHEVTIQPGGGPVTARSKDYLLNSPVAIDFQRPKLETALPAPGILAVFSAVETCSVLVDGQELGFPPIARKPIAAGSHTVALKCPDGKSDSRKVSVTTGGREAVTFGPPGS